MIFFNNKKISSVYKGNELIYPDISKNNLMIYFDSSNIKGNKNILDLSGNSNNGTLQNFILTDYDNGLKFDGVDDYISFNLDLSNTFSIFMTLENMNGTGIEYVLSGINNYIYIRKNNYKIEFSILNNLGKQELFSVDNIPSEDFIKPMYIGYIFDSPNKKVRFYYNGELLKSFDMTENISDTTNISILGRWNGGYYFKGKLYNFQVYNDLINDEEIMKNYLSSKDRWGL